MTVLRADFLTCWKLANMVRKHNLLKYFFYYNDIMDRNIFFGKFDYNEDKTLQLQLKQNINIYIDIGSKNNLTTNTYGKNANYDYKEEDIYSVPTEITLFSYNPTRAINTEYYTAPQCSGVNNIIDYVEYARYMVERAFGCKNPDNMDGETNGIPFVERQFRFNMLCKDTIEEGELEEAEVYLDSIKLVSAK